MRLISVHGPELMSMYFGDSEAGVRRVFGASLLAPAHCRFSREQLRFGARHKAHTREA